MNSVNNERLCVFCYELTTQVKYEVDEVEKQNINFCTKFITQITRYLNIESTKRINWFISKLSSFEYLICEECSKLGTSFCHQYSQWECLNLQMNWQVKRFCDVLQCADKGETSSTAFRQNFNADKYGMDLLPLYIDIQLLRKQIISSGKLKIKSLSQPRVKIPRLDKPKQQQATVNMIETISSCSKDEVGPKEDINFDGNISQLTHSQVENDCARIVQDDGVELNEENVDWSYDHEHNDEMSESELPITTGLNDETADMKLDSSYCDNEITVIKVDCSEDDRSSKEYNYALDTSHFNIPAHDNENVISPPPSPKQLPCSSVNAADTIKTISRDDEVQDEFQVDTPRQPKKSLRSLLKCVKCGKTFTTKSSLDTHIETHDQINEDSNDNSGLEDFNDDNDPINSDNDFEVQDESESINIKGGRRTLDENTEDSVKTEKKKRTNAFKHNRKFKCAGCGREYSHMSSLCKHKMAYIKLGASCKTKLTRKKKVYIKKEEYSCEDYGKAFVDSDSLVSQQQTEGVHDTLPIKTRSKVPITNPESCDICGKKFASHNSLMVHKNYHTKLEVEKVNKNSPLITDDDSLTPIGPFPETECRICKQTFSCRAAVQKHRVVEHKLPL